MTLIGLIWAVFAPLQILIIAITATFFLHLLAFRSVQIKNKKLFLFQFFSWTLTISLIVFLIWHRDKNEFDQICARIKEPQIYKTDFADGIYLNDSTANSFGMRYLQEEGFTWMEAKSIYNRDKYTLYKKENNQISQTEIRELTAKYEVSSEYEFNKDISINKIVIKNRETNEIMAEAKDAHFAGGRAKVFLGSWGSLSCPSLISASGSAAFQKKYHLAKLTLGNK